MSSGSETDRINVQQLHGHWTAWWESRPETAFGGATPAEAIDRLVGFTYRASGT